jgi:transcriptional antiterminator
MLNIIEHLLRNENTSNVKELTDLLQTSERTIRYDIDEINYFLSKEAVGEISKNSKGHLKLLASDDLHRNFITIFHQSLKSEYKQIAIFIKILFCGKINISHLCTQFKVSRPTIKTAISAIKKELKNYQLKLTLYKKEGYVLAGEETNIRRLQLKLLNQYFSLEKNRTFEKTYITELLLQALEEDNITEIEHFIQIVIQHLNKIISDEAYSIICNYLIITIARIKTGCILPPPANPHFLLNTDEFEAIQKSISILETHHGIQIDSSEILTLTDYFIGSHSYNFQMSFYQNWVEFEQLIKKIIDNVSKETQIDLSDDLFLFNGLLNHLKPTIHRLQNEIPLKNSIYSEVISECPLLFKVVKKSLSCIEDLIEKSISNEELSFVVLHFKGAINRHQPAQTIKNILLVCGNGFGSSTIIEQQLHNTYNINIIDSIPFYQFEKYWEEKDDVIDLVVTTLDISKFEIYSPIISVNTLLTDQDISLLDSYSLAKHDKNILLSSLLSCFKEGGEIKNENAIADALKKVFGQKLIDDRKAEKLSIFDMLLTKNIELKVSVTSWEDAIDKVGNILYQNGYTHNDYTYQMKDSINKYGAYVVVSPNFALPHASKEFAIKTGMSLITLKEPILFPGELSVSTILAFSATTQKNYADALYQFLGMVNSDNFVEKALLAEEPQDILTIIKHYQDNN